MAVISLSGVYCCRNAVPKMPWVLMVILPPRESVELAVISLFSAAAKVSELIVIPPTELPALVLIRL